VLTLRLVFHLALRQAEGFVGSVLWLLGLELNVPDHTTLSRRSRSFAGRQPRVIVPRSIADPLRHACGPWPKLLLDTGLCCAARFIESLQNADRRVRE
jgi:hypothetical protein